MVRVNNSYDGTNTPEMDAYLRNLNDFRVAVELSFLPIISHFVVIGESAHQRVLLPSRIFEDQREYLEHLGIKYHKREFDFEISPEEPVEAYDALTRLVRHSRKGMEYSLLDFTDFILEHPEVFADVRIHLNIAKPAIEAARKYHHETSLILESALKDMVPKPNAAHPEEHKSKTLTAFRKFSSPFQLYAFVLSSVKRAIDFEALKLYDFFLDQGITEVRSNKLLEIKSGLAELAQAEYAKRRCDVHVLPLAQDAETGHTELIVDQWAANLRRAFDLRKVLANDFTDYLQSGQAQEDRCLFRTGAFPELVALVHYFYKGKVPEDLQS